MTKNQKKKARRRAKYGFNPAKLQRKLKKEIITRDGAFCKKCGTTERLSVDHIIPSGYGGSSELSNLQILCVQCNWDKAKQEQAEHQKEEKAKLIFQELKKGKKINL